ncbi:YafY family transcriptional regulator [Roseovarius faecimaris]|uniref:YafY family transcriptional regulator n=1 Tax=Roseovarius faecimaris TaxID=2494550 RepID=A0A6I6J4X1_9RHOB|nr:YafY family protein [Roseovarius faecimaris]QGX99808.1 YafY family transcriptional regulator [Roseovarius faecimaris]
MTRSTRMFEIIQILRQAPRPVTAQAIADQLEVTKRTVYRDISSLQAMSVPIEGEAGIGYVMRAGFDLPPLMFTAQEVEALFVGAALLQRTGDAGLQKAARSATGKIAAALPDGRRPHVPHHVSAWTTIAPSPLADTLRDHIRTGAELRITYDALSDQRSTRTILPLAMIYFTDAVLLAAWCGLRQDFRHFRIDRITDCTATGAQYPERCQRLRFDWERSDPMRDYAMAARD